MRSVSRSIASACVVLAACTTSTGDDPEVGSDTSSAGSSDPSTGPDPTASGSSDDAPAESSDGSTSAPADDTSGESGSTGTPVATTPVFVALGDGGWTASSCDRGHTWTAHAFSDETGDHTQWTAFGGLAVHDGAFVAGLGWGGEGGHILHSLDARTWEDLPASSFLEDGMEIGYAIYTAGVASTGAELMIFSQRVWRSTDGASWSTVDVSLPPGAEQLRQLRGFPDAGLLVASVESQSGNNHPQGHFVVVSEDAGMTWTEGSGYTSSCSDPIQHWGDIELVGDVMIVGTGDLCRSPDRGATWELVASPTGGEIHDLFHDDAGFLAVSGSLIFRSDDGTAWTQIGDAGVPLRAAAWSDGAYAAVASPAATLWWSDDATTWTQGEVDTPATGEIWVRDFTGVEIEGDCTR
jgi:hypothetical protein